MFATTAPGTPAAGAVGWPAYWPALPRYPKAQRERLETHDLTSRSSPDYYGTTVIRALVFESHDPPASITAYYRTELARQGWTATRADELNWRRCPVPAERGFLPELRPVIWTERTAGQPTQAQVTVVQEPDPPCKGS